GAEQLAGRAAGDGLDRAARVFVAGHRGLLGRALVRRLEAAGSAHVLTADRAALDLTDGPAVRAFFDRERPDYVLLAAARGGGIVADRASPRVRPTPSRSWPASSSAAPTAANAAGASSAWCRRRSTARMTTSG